MLVFDACFNALYFIKQTGQSQFSNAMAMQSINPKI